MVVMNNKRSFGRTHTHTWTQQPRGCMFARAVAAADCTLYRYTMAMNKCWWGRFFSFFFFFFRRVYRLVQSWERKPQRRKTTGFLLVAVAAFFYFLFLFLFLFLSESWLKPSERNAERRDDLTDYALTATTESWSELIEKVAKLAERLASTPSERKTKHF